MLGRECVVVVYAYCIALRSFNDGRLVNAMYCADVCKNSTIRCKNGGYPSVKNCAICACPDGMGGRRCNEVAESSRLPLQ